MTFKRDGNFGDGSLCVYGYDNRGNKIMIFKGYVDLRKDTVTLYPKVRLVHTDENVGKQTIPIRMLK